MHVLITVVGIMLTTATLFFVIVTIGDGVSDPDTPLVAESLVMPLAMKAIGETVQ